MNMVRGITKSVLFYGPYRAIKTELFFFHVIKYSLSSCHFPGLFTNCAEFLLTVLLVQDTVMPPNTF